MQRHRFDILSFFFGVVFAGLAVTSLFANENIPALQGRWLWPGLLIFGGLVIVAFSLRPRRLDAPEPDTAEPYDPVS